MLKERSSIFVILLTVFIDAVGVGLVYPIASPLLLEATPGAFLPPEATTSLRGLLLGMLMASFTIGQFVGSPIIGGLSDLKGRKRVVNATLLLAAVSYLLGGWSIGAKSVLGILAARFFAGIAAGNAAVMQASMADLSSVEEKAKRFGWLGASAGLGFIMGPYIGGKLSDPLLGFDYATPFYASAVISLVNLGLAAWLFQETVPKAVAGSVNLWAGLTHLKKALQLRHLRALFSVMFMYFFGWELFIVFGPVYLMDRFQFTPSQIGTFYAYNGLWHALSNALIMRWTSRFSSVRVLQIAFPLWGVALFLLGFVHDASFFWLALAPIPGIGAIIFSTGSALVSNLSDVEVQGETLGIYQSVQAAALAFPPLCVGSLVTVYPYFPIMGGTVCLFIATLIWWAGGPRKLRDPKRQAVVQSPPSD